MVKKKSHKKEKKNGNYLLPIIALIVLLGIIFLFNSVNLPESFTEQELQEELDYASYFESKFDCTNKDTFRDSCWRKVLFYESAQIINVEAGEQKEIIFAIQNKEDKSGEFLYSIAPLSSAQFERTGCISPKQSSQFITSDTSGSALLNTREITIIKVSVSAPGIAVEAGCPYRYLITTNKDGKLYDKTYFDIMVKPLA